MSWISKSIDWPNPLQLTNIIKNNSNSIWLDSALASHHDSQISLLGFCPLAEIRFENDCAIISRGQESKSIAHIHAIQWMDDFLLEHKSQNKYAPAWMGQMSYEWAYQLYNLKNTKNEFLLPLAEFIFPGIYLYHDHLHHKSEIIFHDSFNNEAETLIQQLDNPVDQNQDEQKSPPTFQKEISKDIYKKNIEAILERIARGDCYQVNYSERLHFLNPPAPANLYLKLRNHSPAPFMAFANLGENFILSASPECYLKIHHHKIITRPIKGTRPRSTNPNEDEALKNELNNSKKDASELLMIVDLMRNDLGKISESGSVEVNCLKKVESFSHVHHLVATISAILKPQISPLQAVTSCFPPGSITGAPKHKAMEIIAELESTPRGIYTGAIGFISANNEAIFNVAIRTALYQNNQIILGSGGGIVADSNPEQEFNELMIKAENFLQLLR